ncbi:MAG: hypothetical protein IH901_03085, partial [Proteobacteria bacterium]|nr:hypothetical protein [Pseudomonadota bacterium]
MSGSKEIAFYNPRMTIGDYIWEIFSNIYYFAKDFQTLLAALIVIFGGRAVYRREMKIHREKQKEKSKATALYLQNKIEEILTSLVAFSTLAVEQFNSQKKEIGKGVNPLETLLPMTAGFYDKEDFFTNREILTDIYFLEIEKKSISLFFSSFEELRIILKGPAYPWDLPSGLKKGNLGEAEFKLIKQTNLEIYKMYLAYIESPLKWGIRAVETLHQAEAASRFAGVRSKGRIQDWHALVAQKDELVATMRQQKYADLLPSYNTIAYMEGRA